MAVSTAERIETLEAAAQKLAPDDPMPEAGRKLLLAEFIKMLRHEDGSRTGQDIEDVHDMRVAIRRMRSAFRLLKPYFKSRDSRPHSRGLSRVAWVLGDVRDLDVLIEDLRVYQQTLEAENQTALQEMIDHLDQSRMDARQALNSVLDSKSYRRFLKAFSLFLTTAGAGVKAVDRTVTPLQVRHVLPGLIYDRLAAVRAYEAVIADADDVTLHALRIEFKRLRYTVSLFEGVLGSQISDFIDEIKAIQDCLGHLNDAATARARLDAVLDSDDVAQGALSAYLQHLEERSSGLRERFVELWQRFNTRRVQQKLSTAILALR
jgi:CHAD domain-containing protein